MHHLIIDGISWKILLEDLNTLYALPINEVCEKKLDKPVSFFHWAKYLKKISQEPLVHRYSDFWLNILKNIKTFPAEFSNNEIRPSFNTLTVSINSKMTTDITENIPSHTSHKTQEILLTAVLLAFSEWSKMNSLSICLESHGRNVDVPFDISRTLGWFTCFYP
jgi:NRPS condensation-like uncharacterized protein